MKLYEISYFVGILIGLSEEAKILGIFPIAAKSHFTVNNAILKSLIDVGHQVTVITPFPEQASQENYTSIIDTSGNTTIYVSLTPYEELSTLSAYDFMNMMIEIETSHCYNLMNLPEIRKIFNSNEKLYDIVFTEIAFLYKCFLPVAENMKVPIIGTVTLKYWLVADDATGNPNNPAYIPYELNPSWETNDLYGRAHNLWDAIAWKWFNNYRIKPVLTKFHEDHVNLFGQQNKLLDMEPDLIFYNNHASFLSRPMNPNAIEIGGIQVKPAKPLPKELEKFIDEAEHGVIVFSLGSIIRAALLPIELLDAFKKAFAEIPQRVIWKFEEEIENLPENVMIMKWLPQRDILEHKNVIAFISHCGQGGIYEAITTVTPIIAIPLFVEQASNAEILENKGVAVRLSIESITKQKLLIAINSVINDPRYRNNMKQLSRAFHDRPMTPQQTVQYWTEYVIRHRGAQHLKTAANSLNWFQYLLLDVLSFILFFAIVAAYLCYWAFSTLHSRYLNTHKKLDTKNKTN